MRLILAMLVWVGSACADARDVDVREVVVPDEVAPDVTAYAPLPLDAPDVPNETRGDSVIEACIALVIAVTMATVASPISSGKAIGPEA
jgi:hypothetical protein